MRTLGIILLLVILAVTINAAEVIDLDPTTTIVIDGETQESTNLQLLQRFATLENRLANIATKDDITASTTFIFNNLSADFENKTDFMVIAILFGFIFVLAILITGYFILKSRRRI